MTLNEAKIYIGKAEKIQLSELTGLYIGHIDLVLRKENIRSKAVPYILAMAEKRKKMIQEEVETLLENPKK